ncbi:MAG: hypothetical protein A3J48_00370 [Candidatus Doudnabacteria bacterium RIFCSPHIGHO2_02_FULL_46_11]|uniref:Nucleoside 2-deoxyribosyltransferase n=1 Tax=Candidatus Doudnabacteria bacterium RIFCSPHIGHO2_02_FULL_46_11 TaxID=1817832 RepID=A0A1F5P4T9_9BACT|nr:MAG: hypothetical protein A3J48_00370 [Candidatus Doudnabacteria bacterium RIFCSPHIGHO2_02_FULL_46_11]
MKIFIAYRFTGVEFAELQNTVGVLCKKLTEAGHSVFSTLDREDYYKQNKSTTGDIIKEAFSEIEKADIFVALVNSVEKSEGQLIEIGFVKALDKKFILLIKNELRSVHLRYLADKVIEFSDMEDLYKKISNIS